MNLKIKPLIIISVLISFASNSFSQINISLEQAIEKTLNDNLQIKQSLINSQIQGQVLRQARMGLIPTLNANVNESLNFGRSLDYTTYNYVTQKTNLANETLTANVTLFQGFQKINQISANKLLLQADQSATQKVKNDLVLNVVLSFLSALSGKDQLAAANEQLDLAQKQLDVATKSYSVGKKTSADVSTARSQVAKAELNITTIQNQMNNSVLDLIQLMNLPRGSKLALKEPTGDAVQLEERSTLDIYNKAIAMLPEAKQALFARKYEETQIKVVNGSYYPSLSLSGGVASNYSHVIGYNNPFFGSVQSPFLAQFKANLTEYIGVSLSIPILNNFSTQISVKKEKLNLESAILNEQSVKDNVYKAVNQANEDVNAAYKTYNYSKEAYSAAVETYQVTKKRYDIGSSSAVELNQALTDMNQAQFGLIHSKYDFIFKEKVVDFYLGKPLSY